MIPEIQRDEMIDLENAKTKLLEALKPFVEAGKGVHWEDTKDYHKFYPVNAHGRPILMGDLRRVMKVYERYKAEENNNVQPRK
jgi:hypothetical protein